ncbi:CDP-alcohol phosphatidyltransferase family protein [Cryptosporangium sp. NPDC048952]|uniref:CDP-alcohol phosphatidyltransferase family protein n=1 Tax=Cryptosporangium sp. NPDC048952 TaxID=3363961 RepID=UPI0037178C6A
MTLDVRVSTASPLCGVAAGVLLQTAVLGGLAAGVGLGPSGWLAGAAFAVSTWAVLSSALIRSGATSLGPANAVTLARCTLVGGVTALVADSLANDHPPVVVLVTLAVVAWLMDGIDGQVARRTGTTTKLGGRFDGEVDSILALVLSVYVADSLGLWVVVAIGAYRYLFLMAGWGLPWLRAELPRRQSRSAIAAVQGIVLIVAAAGVVPDSVMTTIAGVSLAVLTFSFGRDILSLYRKHTTETAVVRTAPASEPFVGVGQSS